MTQEELKNLTPEERARLEASEQEALRMYNREMKEGRWYPRRVQRFSLLVVLQLFIALVVVIAAVVSLIVSVFNR